MKSQRCVFLLLLGILLGSRSAALAKSYSIELVSIQAEVLIDGSMLVGESRHYRFDGQFTWADYDLPLKKPGRISDFSLSENGRIYRVDSSEEPGTYFLLVDENRMYVKWYYSAHNESRVFTLKYRVQEAVNVYQDIAELYYKFMGEDHPQTIGLVDVKLKLPFPADTSQVRAWAHGPLHGDLRFENGLLRLKVPQLAEDNFWEVRAVFPRDWVSGAEAQSSFSARERIFSEEAQLAANANQQRLDLMNAQDESPVEQKKAFESAFYLAFIGLIFWISLYLRFGRSHPVSPHEICNTQIPNEISPAVANYVFNMGQFTAGAMVSTIFDLARRGFLKLEEVKQKERSLFGEKEKTHYILKLVSEKFKANSDKLSKAEINLIDFLFNTIAEQQNELDFKRLNKRSRQVMKWFSQWKKLVKEEWGGRPIFEKSSIWATVFSWIIAVACIVAGALMLTHWGQGGLVAMIIGFVLSGISFAILRFTPETKRLRVRLLALKKEFSPKRQPQSFGSNPQLQFDQFFVFAIALGVGQKALKIFLQNVPVDTHGFYFPWYSGHSISDSPVSFANAAASMVTSIGTTMSTAAGVGGGATTGGGGGAGGATGGAG